MSDIQKAADEPQASGFDALLAIDQAVLDAIPAAVYVCAADGVIARYNRRAAELWGRSPEPGDTDERFCGSFRLHDISGNFLPHDKTPMEAALRTGESQRDREVVIERPDGSRVVVLVNIEPLRGPGRQTRGAVNCFQDITERKRSDEARQRLVAIIDSSDDAIVAKDVNGIVTDWNRGAERLFGYSADEIIGRSITTIIPAEHRDEEARILACIRRGERVAPYETVRRRKDGSLVDVSLTVSPVKDAEGNIVGASKVARDISERKRGERVRDLLAHELNHRVKNSLAVVQAIANQTFAEIPEASGALQSFRGRLGALATAHDLLIRERWEKAPLDGLAERVVGIADTGERVEIEGPPVTLAPRAAVTVSMALHELCTNAIKHGALSTPGGSISLGWEVTGQPAALTLRWRERDGPPVSPPKRRGFGMLMLETVVSQDLDGDVSVEFRPEGFACTIRLPLSSESGVREHFWLDA